MTFAYIMHRIVIVFDIFPMFGGIIFPYLSCSKIYFHPLKIIAIIGVP